MSTTEDIVSVCRFCGGEANEEPTRFDPAPHTCPRCLDERMHTLLVRAETFGLTYRDADSMRMWLEQHLVEDVGFTREFAVRFAAGDQAWVERKFLEYVLERGVDSP